MLEFRYCPGPRSRMLAFLMLSSVVSVGCNGGVSGHEGHGEAEGLAVRDGADTLVDVDGQDVTGQITLSVDGELELTVDFLDHDGDVVEGHDSYLEVELADPLIAGWEDHGAESYGGHLTGLTAGSTTAVFRMMHGVPGSGHADYVSPDVVVEVTP